AREPIRRKARFPVAEPPARRFVTLRWQGSRLAEQDFVLRSPPSQPHQGSVALGISPVTVAGAAAFRTQTSRFEPYRIPSSPVVRPEPTQAHHLPTPATWQCESPPQIMSEQDATEDADSVASEASVDARHATKMAK